MRLSVVDSHTEGEPTRVVLGDPLGLAPERHRLRDALRERHDWLRRTLCLEPRGTEIAVGAYVIGEPRDGLDVTFFNSAGYLGMCGHATIGVLATLAHLDQLRAGPVQLRTPQGPVKARLLDRATAEFENVPSYRQTEALTVETPEHGVVRGDVAYGGNWFFLLEESDHDLAPGRAQELLGYTRAVLRALAAAGHRLPHGGTIDHIELTGPARRPDAHARNFVLCPGGEFDRSPCGTGTSAKMACLHADGQLGEGAEWRQEGFAGGLFVGSVRRSGPGVVPTIRGTARMVAETTVIVDPEDPMVSGLGWR